MINLLKEFFREEDGLGTVEIVILIAVLVGIALIFKDVIIEFVKRILKGIFNADTEVDTSGLAKEITGGRK